MSFSRSKVERFPSSSGGPKIKLLERKRPYMYSDLSSSMSSCSFQSTPTQKGHTKEINSEKNTVTSNSSRCKNKVPTQRVSALHGSRRKVIVSKPQCSPTFRGGGSNAKRNLRRSGITPCKNQQHLSSKNKAQVEIGIAVKDDSLTSKRTKLVETSYESYSTPLTSPSSEKTESPTVIEKVYLEDDSGKGQTLTLTPYPLESTRIFNTPYDEASWVEQSIGLNADDDACISTENQRLDTTRSDEHATVTTAGRMSKRLSSSRQSMGNLSSHLWSPTLISGIQSSDDLPYGEEQFNRQSLHSREWEPSFDFLNSAFMQLSIQDPPQHEIDAPGSINLINCSFSQASDSSFSSDNIRFPVPSTPRKSNARPRSIALSNRIRNAVANLFCRKKRQSDSAFSQRFNLFTLDTPKAKIDTRRNCPSSTPVSSRGFRRGKMVHYLPTVKMRRFLHALQLFEARQSLEDIKFSIVMPAQMHIQSQDFWMPILEFVAGQVLEIIQGSLHY